MPTTAQIALIYVPCGSEEEATRIAANLIEERLVACGNIYRSRSIYHWEGEMRDEEEHVLLCKTTSGRVDAARRRVLELHSYEVPCVLKIEGAEANWGYAMWVAGEVAGDGAYFGSASSRAVG